MSVKTATVIRAEIETVEDLREVMTECMAAWVSKPFEIEKFYAYVTGLAAGLIGTKEPLTTATPVAEGENHG
jgi:hypothetical protein